MLKKLIKSWIFWLTATATIVVIGLYRAGFRITYDPNLPVDWNAVSAVGQWVVGIGVPIAAVYIQHRLESDRKDVSQSNLQLYQEFRTFKEQNEKKLKTLLELVDDNGDIVLDGGNWDEEPEVSRKEKALKYINISMFAKTEDIAEHLGITKDEAYDLLIEMVRHDGIISCAGYSGRENIDGILWQKKRK